MDATRSVAKRLESTLEITQKGQVVDVEETFKGQIRLRFQTK